jgi:hypothetical protein
LVSEPAESTQFLRNGDGMLEEILYISGDRKYHIPPLDPLTVKEIRTVDGQLDMAALNIKAEGIKDIILEDIR